MSKNSPTVLKETIDQSSINALMDATANDMEAVNALILSRAESHVDMVPEIARYLIDAGGKRLRPMLTLICAQMFDGASGNQIKYAAAVEFMHNATLLHDDVVDESEMRRGKPAARKIWGNQASVLVGDFLLGQAFMMMVETGELEALRTLASAAAIIAEGEVFQLSKATDMSTTDADYLQIIGAKTATLFEAATEVGAMAGGASEAEQNALATYGRELGLAFQIVDDVLDYGGVKGELGKNTGDDLREGKMTLPIILALAETDDGERELVKSALGDMDAGADVFGEVLAVLNKYRTLEISTERALQYAQNAREALLELPESANRGILGDIADYCVARVN